jgi:Zn-dependent protease
LLLWQNDPTIPMLIGVLAALFIGMTVHEFAHNYVAHLMGDPVPAREGRLTLNPMVHIYWPGFLMFLILGFGILGTAPISPHRMRNPRWGHLAATAAGPFSNLLVAIVFAIIFRIVGSSNFTLWEILYWIVLFNVILFLFNLLPLFPIDGWHIVLALLPAEQAIWWQRNAQNTQIVFIGLILLSYFPLGGLPDPLGLILIEPVRQIMRLLVF